MEFLLFLILVSIFFFLNPVNDLPFIKILPDIILFCVIYPKTITFYTLILFIRLFFSIITSCFAVKTINKFFVILKINCFVKIHILNILFDSFKSRNYLLIILSSYLLILHLFLIYSLYTFLDHFIFTQDIFEKNKIFFFFFEIISAFLKLILLLVKLEAFRELPLIKIPIIFAKI